MQNRNDSHYRQASGNHLALRVIAAFLLAILSACTTAPSRSGPTVVVSTSILGDIVSQVSGDDASVEVLMPLGASPHDFAPSAQQVAAISDADLVVVIGLGLEEALLDVTETARLDGVAVLEVGPNLDPLLLTDSTEPDPHVWLDPQRMAAAVDLIANALEEVAPDGPWLEHASSYRVELEALDQEIAGAIETIPAERRTLVTNHDSLGYFADRYGLDVVGTIIPGGSTLASPSPADLAALVAVIESTDTPAIFAETSEPDRLAATVAAEIDHEVTVVTLYTGSLGTADDQADSYLAMMRTNTARIVTALTPEPR